MSPSDCPQLFKFETGTSSLLFGQWDHFTAMSRGALSEHIF